MADKAVTYPDAHWTALNTTYDAMKLEITKMGVDLENILKVNNPGRPATLSSMLAMLLTVHEIWHRSEAVMAVFETALHEHLSIIRNEVRA